MLLLNWKHFGTTTLPAMVPTQLERPRKLCFFPWQMFLQFHCLKTYIEIVKGHYHNFVKTSSSAVLNNHIASAADTFSSKEGAIKTIFWNGKVVDEDDAEVSKHLTVFKNASFDSSTCFGFPECCFKGLYTLLIKF